MALIAAGIIGVGAVAAAGISAASDSGDNTYRATNVKDTDKYESNRFEYGGAPDGAEMLSRRYGLAADRVGRRVAHQSTPTFTDYNRANAWEQQALAARNEQATITNLMHRRAAGELPSIAGAQARQDMGLIQQGAQGQIGMLQQGAQNQIGLLNQNAQNQMRQAQAAQMAGAASARGSAGMALAQQNAANNIANTNQGIGLGVAQQTGNIGMHAAQQAGNIGMSAAQAGQNVSNQAQINAMNERMAAEQAAYGAYSGIRAADMGSHAQMAQQAQYQAGLNQANSQFNAGHRATQAAQNDQTALALYGMENSIRSQQLQADLTQQQLMASQHMGAQGIQAGINAQNAANQTQLINSMVGGVSGAAQVYANHGGYGGGGTYGATAPASGPPPLQNTRADGGPVAAGETYLVGERGPEMVVPRRVGYRAEGGPVSSGQPYIVGERGPELLVPRTDGVVIPNEVIDAGEIDERESYRQPVDFRRDSPADQRRVQDQYYAALLKEADAYKAGMRASIGGGASVARDEGEIDEPPPPQLMGGREDPYGQRPQAMGLLEAFPQRERPQMMASSEAFPSSPGVLSDDRAKLALVETDAYLRGLKQGSREQKQGFTDWDTADTAAYRKTLLEQKMKPEAKPRPVAASKPEADYHRMTNAERAVYEKSHGMDWARTADEEKAWEERRGIEEYEKMMAGQPGRLPPSQREANFRASLAATDPPLPTIGLAPATHSIGTRRPPATRARGVTSDDKAKRGVTNKRGDMTDQLAIGLAPIDFEYKPGFGPSGRRTGVRAQAMETQSVTAPAIRKRPDGLREIDQAAGLSTALAGVGHLAGRVRELEGKKARR